MTRCATLSVRPSPPSAPRHWQGHAAVAGSTAVFVPTSPRGQVGSAHTQADGPAASLRAGSWSNAWNVNFNNGNVNNNDISNTNEVRCVRGS